MKNLRFALATTVTALMLTAVPAGAAVRITSTTDPLAPEGATPKLVFTASGVAKNRKYVIRWDAGSDVPTSCTRFGSSIVDTSGSSRKLVFDPLPYGSYDGGFYKPFCADTTYKGQLRLQRAGRFELVTRFRFTAEGVV